MVLGDKLDPMMTSFESDIEVQAHDLTESGRVASVEITRVETIRGVETGLIVYKSYDDAGVLRTWLMEITEMKSEAQVADDEAQLTARGPGSIQSMGIDMEAHPAPSDALRNGDC